MSEPLPSVKLLKRAYGDRLESNTLLTDLIFAGRVWNGVPGLWDYSKVCLEFGVQADTDDPRNGYGQNGLQLQFRLVAHDRGSEPGMWDYERCYDVLAVAHDLLVDTPLTTVDNQRVWRVRRTAGIPEMPSVDPGTGYTHIAVGSLYEVRTYKS